MRLPKFHRRATEAVSAVAILGLGAFVVVTAGMGRADAGVPPLSVDVVKIKPTYAVVTTVCPVDPPTVLLVSGEVDGVRVLLGRIDGLPCDRTRQRFTVPIAEELGLERGEIVTEVEAVVSGDSGEITLVPRIDVRVQ